MTIASNLQEAAKGHRLTTDEWNAVVRDLKTNEPNLPGIYGEALSASALQQQSTMRFIQVYATTTIPPYALFSVTGVSAPSADEPMRAVAARWGINHAGSPLAWFTNGSVQIDSGTWGWARPINAFEPVKIIVAGTDPVIGDRCGPELDTYGITAGMEGFVCLAVSDAGYAIIMRSREFVSVMGCVTSIIPPFDSCNRILGEGTIDLLYTNNGNKTFRALDPSTGVRPWSITVYNMRSNAFTPGDLVVATSVVGVGLVIIDYGDDCQTCTSSSSLQSESESSSSGSECGSGNCTPFEQEVLTRIFLDGCILAVEKAKIKGDKCGCITVVPQGIELLDISKCCCGGSSSAGSSAGSSGSGSTAADCCGLTSDDSLTINFTSGMPPATLTYTDTPTVGTAPAWHGTSVMGETTYDITLNCGGDPNMNIHVTVNGLIQYNRTANGVCEPSFSVLFPQDDGLDDDFLVYL